MSLKTYAYFTSNFEGFGLHVGSPRGVIFIVSLACFLLFFPIRAQDMPQAAPRRCKRLLRRTEDPPRALKCPPKRTQNIPKDVPKSPKHSQDVPKRFSGRLFSWSWTIQIWLKVFSSIFDILYPFEPQKISIFLIDP